MNQVGVLNGLAKGGKNLLQFDLWEMSISCNIQASRSVFCNRFEKSNSAKNVGIFEDTGIAPIFIRDRMYYLGLDIQ